MLCGLFPPSTGKRYPPQRAFPKLSREGSHLPCSALTDYSCVRHATIYESNFHRHLHIPKPRSLLESSCVPCGMNGRRIMCLGFCTQCFVTPAIMKQLVTTVSSATRFLISFFLFFLLKTIAGDTCFHFV